MEAKEKAEELVKKYLDYFEYDLDTLENYYSTGTRELLAKKCDLICVEEIIQQIKDADYAYIEDDIEYWNDVRNKINKMNI